MGKDKYVKPTKSTFIGPPENDSTDPSTESMVVGPDRGGEFFSREILGKLKSNDGTPASLSPIAYDALKEILRVVVLAKEVPLSDMVNQYITRRFEGDSPQSAGMNVCLQCPEKNPTADFSKTVQILFSFVDVILTDEFAEALVRKHAPAHQFYDTNPLIK